MSQPARMSEEIVKRLRIEASWWVGEAKGRPQIADLMEKAAGLIEALSAGRDLEVEVDRQDAEIAALEKRLAELLSAPAAPRERTLDERIEAMVAEMVRQPEVGDDIGEALWNGARRVARQYLAAACPELFAPSTSIEEKP